MRPTSLALAIAAVLTCAAAHAADGPSDADKAAARNHYEQGRRLYDRQRYLEAVPEFEQAYQLTGDPVFLYNVAQAYRLANRLDEAIHYYNTYLKRDPETPRRTEVERRLEELRRAKDPPNQVSEPSGRPAAAERSEAPSPVAPYTGQPGQWGPPAQPYAYPGPAQPYPAPGTPPAYPAYPSAAPPPAPPAPVDTRHQRGFHFRVSLGLGGAAAGASYMNSSATLSGSAALLNLRLGLFLKPRVAAWFQYGALASVDPKLSTDYASSTFEGTMYFQYPAGLGMTYYLSPTLALSGALHLFRSALEPRLGGRSESKLGSGFYGELAKELPLGSSWNLALALQTSLSAAQDELDGSIAAFHLVLALLLGYN